MNLTLRLTQFFSVRPEEIKPLRLLVLFAFCRGLAGVFFDAPANTLFITEFGSGPLPYVYLGAAFSSLLLGFGYSRLGAKLAPAKVLRITLITLFFSVLIFYAGILTWKTPTLIMGMMIWKEAIFMLGNIVMWASAGYLFNVRQGKRLFGLVAGGSILATIIGGALVPLIIKFTGISLLFFLSSIAIAGMLWSFQKLTFSYRSAFLLSNEKTHEPEEKHSLSQIFHNRYLGLFLSLSILSNFGFFFVDYVYFNQVEFHYPDEKALAGFFGVFTSIIGIVQLATSTLLAGPLITRFGLGFGLMALPGVTIIGVGIAASVSLLWGVNPSFFWLILITKLADEALRSSLLAPSFRILYQPLPPRDRLKFQTVTESIIEPLGVGLAGAVLLFFTKFYPVPLYTLCFLLVGILATWLGVAERLRREYTRLLSKALSKRRLNEISLSMEDGSTVQVFEEGLQNENPSEVIYCLNMLEEIRHPQLRDFILSKINHPEESIAICALEKLERFGTAEDQSVLHHQLHQEKNPRVRGFILQALCALSEKDTVEIMTPFLTDPSPVVRSHVLTGLMRHGGIDGVLVAGKKLQEMISSSNSEERLLGIQTLGNIGIKSFYRPLFGLLQHPDPATQRAAIEVAGRLANPQLIPLLIQRLDDSMVRSVAFRALSSIGAPALPLIQEALLEPQRTCTSKQRLLKLVGKIGGDEAIQLLKRWMKSEEKGLRQQVLHSLSTSHYQATESEISSLHEQIIQESKAALQSLQSWNSLSNETEYHILKQALLSEFRIHKDQILLLLSFLYDARPILYARRELESTNASQKAHALELIDNVIEKKLKEWVLPLLEDISPQEKLERMKNKRTSIPLSTENCVRALISAPRGEITSWTRSCALYTSQKILLPDRVQLAQAFYQSSDPLILETSRAIT